MTTRSTPATRPGETSGRLARDHRALAQDVARRVVIDLAPREARHFEQRARAHFRPRLPWSGRRTTRFDLLGLPSELLTPTALAVATALLGAVSTELVGTLTQRTRGRLRRRGLHRAETASAVAAAVAPVVAAAVAPPQAPPTAAGSEPTAADLVRWHASALEAARGCRVPEELARRIADAALAHFVQSLAARTAPVAAEAPTREALPADSPDPSPPSPPTPPGPPSPPTPPSPPVDDGPPAADS